jgi:hypothetical protein
VMTFKGLTGNTSQQASNASLAESSSKAKQKILASASDPLLQRVIQSLFQLPKDRQQDSHKKFPEPSVVEAGPKDEADISESEMHMEQARVQREREKDERDAQLMKEYETNKKLNDKLDNLTRLHSEEVRLLNEKIITTQNNLADAQANSSMLVKTLQNCGKELDTLTKNNSSLSTTIVKLEEDLKNKEEELLSKEKELKMREEQLRSVELVYDEKVVRKRFFGLCC